ncbi:MAG TPA: RloB family protein [Phycisphaerales bacterium]|nr:RloB family protein [Phycisphaerales bacterium]HMP38680.1 RloB family protein [Phycisphaerales bacterium]
MVVICCDDERAAPRYFDVLKRELKDSLTIHVRCAPRSGVRSSNVLEAAEREKRNFAQRGDARDRTVIWIVIDAECSDHDRAEAQVVGELAKASGIECAISDPCFEVWTLLHLEAKPGLFKRCAEVVRAVEAAWQKAFGEEFRKPNAKYERLSDRRMQAIEWATRRKGQVGCCTGVHRLVQQVLDFARDSQST